MYLALLSNPLAKQNLSFEEFRQKLKQKSAGPIPKPEAEQKPEVSMTRKQMQNQVMQSQKILSGFVPPERQGK